MKVTVTFGDTAVVVPCKAGWTVRDLIEQATRRYRRILEQHGDSTVKAHHLEYTEGGILDMDDLLTDLVEDRDKVRPSLRTPLAVPCLVSEPQATAGKLCHVLAFGLLSSCLQRTDVATRDGLRVLAVRATKRALIVLTWYEVCVTCGGGGRSSHPQISSSGASPSVNHAGSALPSVSPSHHPLAPNGVRRSGWDLTCLRLLWPGRRNLEEDGGGCWTGVGGASVSRPELVAVFDRNGRTDSPRETMSNGFSSAAPSPEPLSYYPHLQYQEPNRGEIEVNEATLKGNTPLLVRSSSDSALAPPHEVTATPPPDDDRGNGAAERDVNQVLKGALDRLRADDPPAKMSQVNFSTLTRFVEFPGDWGPLGIHVVPYCSSLSGRTLGLHIKGIEEHSRARKENLFQEDECIVQINNTPLQDRTFAQSQDVFRQAMGTSSVRLEVLPAANKPRYEKSLIGQLFSADGKDSTAKAKSPMVVRAKTDAQPEPKQDVKPKLEVRRPDSRSKTPEPGPVNLPPAEHLPGNGSLERGSPTPPARAANSSPTPTARSQSPLAGKGSAVPGLANLTNRKGGKRIKIDLKKGAEGLGFTVVTRDSSVHGPGPILVKNILPRGAAVKDGRLQPGDRILEVNGVDMTGRSQEELVAMLRSTKQGESVCVVVARQEDIFLPRELKGEDVGSLVLEDGREQLMYEIPLNESGSAGLGVSLKGNKSRETGEDLGIFIKSIIHGGAAYKDGRLSVNDQLIAVNGESLIGRSNHAAMETLRRSSMSSEGNARGTIQLVVLRPPRQMNSATPAASAATNAPATHQPSSQMGSSNQVRVGDASHHHHQQQQHQQPPPPCRSSSLLPTLRRRASEPLPHSHRQRYTQRPGETHTRYTYGVYQRERHSNYTFGFAQRDSEYSDDEGGYAQKDVYQPASRYEFGFIPHSQTLSSFNRPADGNLNRESYDYTHSHTRSRTLADVQRHAELDNTCCLLSGHARSRTPDAPRQHSSHSSSYTENIRAMAGQMYGDPPAHSRIPGHGLNRNTHTSAGRYLDAHSHNYAHNRALTRQHHHLQLSVQFGKMMEEDVQREPRGHGAYQGPSGPSRPPNTEPAANGTGHAPMASNNYGAYGSSASAPYPAVTVNGSHGHYSNNDKQSGESFPPPPSPGAVEEMNRDLPLTPSRYRYPPHNTHTHTHIPCTIKAGPHRRMDFYLDSRLANDKDNVPRNRASKSMDLVADESNVGSLVGQRDASVHLIAHRPSHPLLSLLSLRALSWRRAGPNPGPLEVQLPGEPADGRVGSQAESRPSPGPLSPPAAARGPRAGVLNQSFRIAIDKSYEGPSEDDDDLSEHSSGHETPVSSSSRQGLDAEDGKKKRKTKGKKKDKKGKGKKKTDDAAEDLEKKTKKKGFGLLRFGKKKDDKSKDAAKASKSKLEALSEEELDRIPDNRDGYDPRYAEIHSGHVTPDPASLPDVEDDESDPSYARINNFRQPPSPQSFISRTPSPAAVTASQEDLDGLYAKVNKTRPPPALQNQLPPQADSDQRLQGLRREHQQARAAPGYEELEAARRRVLEHDPNRMAPRGAESRPVHHYEEVDRLYATHPRRDPYDYPTHSRPVPREPVPYSGHYHEAPASSHPGRSQPLLMGTHSQQAPANPRYYPPSPHAAGSSTVRPLGRTGRPPFAHHGPQRATFTTTKPPEA
ncbi:hypothetical protein L3Q82_009780, partial [Scortum barcoo]